MNQIIITCPEIYRNINMNGAKIQVIKAIRALTGMGLKEAKDASEIFEPQTITIRTIISQQEFNDNIATLKANDVIIGTRVQEILEELRRLSTEAMKLHEDDLANDILQLVLAQKLRRPADSALRIV